jgi:ABC-type Mn2+/Zn2+ transport system permease subunit
MLLLDEFLLRAVISSVAIALTASVAGTLTVFRKTSFLVAGASHSALAGASLAVLLNSLGYDVNYFAMALVFATFAAFLASYSSRSGDINTGIAISFALSMCLTAVFLSATREYASRAWQLFFGDLLLLSDSDVFLILGSTSVLLTITALFYHKFLFISFDPEGAAAFGLNIRLMDNLLITLISISVVSAMKAVGAILVFAIFVAPAATAKIFASKIEFVFYLSMMIAGGCLMFGILLSLFVPIPAGAFAALVASLIYFISAFRYGADG